MERTIGVFTGEAGSTATQAANDAASDANSAADRANAAADEVEVYGLDAEKHAQNTTSFSDSDGNPFDKGAKGWSIDAETAKTAAQTAETNAEAAQALAESNADTAVSAASDAASSASLVEAVSLTDYVVDTVSDLSGLSPSADETAWVYEERSTYVYDGSQWNPSVTAKGFKRAKNYSSLSAAVAACSDEPLHLTPAVYAVSSDLNVPAGVTLKADTGAIIRPANGVTLTLPSFEGDLSQHFDLSLGGSVIISSGTVHAPWFDTLSGAIAAVTAGGKLELGVNATYTTAAAVSLSTSMEIKNNGAVIQASANMNEVVNISASVIWDSPIVDGNDLANRGVTFSSGASFCVLDHPEVKNLLNYAGQANSTAAIRIEDGTHHIGILEPYLHDIEAGSANSNDARGILISDVSGGATPYDILIRGGSIENVGPYDNETGDAEGIVIQDFTDRVDVRIIGTRFVDCEKRCVKIQAPGVLVKDCQFSLTRGTTTATRAYSFLSIYASDVTVQGCQGKGGAALYAVDVETIAAIGAIKNISIEGNSFEFDSGADISNTDLIRFSGSSSGAITNANVRGNILQNGRYGLRVWGDVSRSGFEGNAIRSTSSHAVYFNDIGGGGTYPTYCSILGTVLQSVSGWGFHAGGGSNHVVGGTVGTGGFGKHNLNNVTSSSELVETSALGSTVQEWSDGLERLGTEIDRVRDSTPGGVAGTSLVPRGLYETGTDIFVEADTPDEFQTDSMIMFRVSSGASWASTGSAGFVLVYTVNGAANGIRQMFFPDSGGHFWSRSSTGTSSWGTWQFMQTNRNGTTAERPASPAVGQQYFDSTLGYAIWYDGTNWVDAAGTTV